MTKHTLKEILDALIQNQLKPLNGRETLFISKDIAGDNNVKTGDSFEGYKVVVYHTSIQQAFLHEETMWPNDLKFKVGKSYPDPDFFLLHMGIGIPEFIKLDGVNVDGLRFSRGPNFGISISGKPYQDYLIQLECWLDDPTNHLPS